MSVFRSALTALLLGLLGTFALSAPASAQDYGKDRGTDLKQFAERLSQSARRAALASGSADVGLIACDGFVCTCKGAIDCAWLAWGCANVGGIQGFDGECYLPGRDPGAGRAVLDLRLALLPGALEATCDGIFCSCSGGTDSADCKKLSATCIDEVSCVGDNCGCIGGTADE